MTNKTTRMLVALAITGLIATACGGSETASPADPSPDDMSGATGVPSGTEAADSGEVDDVVLGWSGPFTGPLEAMAQTMEAGITVGTELVNSEAGDGCPALEWVIKDDALSPDTAVAQTNEFLNEGIEIMVGPAVNTPFLPTRQYYADNEIPQFLVGTASDGIDLEAFPNVYRTFFDGDDEAEVVIEYLKDVLGATEIAILVENTGSGLPGAQSFERAVDTVGGVTIVSSQVFPAGEANLSPYIEEIRDSGADAIALWAVGAPNTANVVKAIDEVGLDIPVAGDIGALFKGTPELAGESMANVDLYAGAWRSELYVAGNEPPAAAVEVRDAVKAELGLDEMIDSVHLSIMYYNTVQVVQEALCRSGGDASAEALRTALYEGPINTLTGDVYEFGPDNHDGYVKANLSVAHITPDSWNDGFWLQAEGAP